MCSNVIERFSEPVYLHVEITVVTSVVRKQNFDLSRKLAFLFFINLPRRLLLNFLPTINFQFASLPLLSAHSENNTTSFSYHYD